MEHYTLKPCLNHDSRTDILCRECPCFVKASNSSTNETNTHEQKYSLIGGRSNFELENENNQNNANN